MAAVVEFPFDRVRKSAARDQAWQAQVIIFPGERFERLEFSLADRLPARGGRITAHARLLDVGEE